VLRFWRRMIENRKLAQLDADMLMEQHGPVAYEVAWTLSREVDSGELIEQRPDGHWDRVLALIAARNLRDTLHSRRRQSLVTKVEP
jgi:hypothetical protein